MYSNKGFSLVQVMVAAGLMGGLSLVMLQSMDNLNQGQVHLSNYEEELEFKRGVKQILNDPDYCRLSLAGDGLPGEPANPVTFYKTNIDEIKKDEGLEFELFLADQDLYKRSQKKFSGIDENFNRYKKIEVDSIKLYLLNNPHKNYEPSSFHKDIGKVVVSYRKNMRKGKFHGKIFEYDLSLKMKTNVDGETTILSCGHDYNYKALGNIFYHHDTESKEYSGFGEYSNCKNGYVSTGACSSTKTSNCRGKTSLLKCKLPSGNLKADESTNFTIPASHKRLIQCPPLHFISSFCSGQDDPLINRPKLCPHANNKAHTTLAIKCTPFKIPDYVRATYETYQDIYSNNIFDELDCPEGTYLVGLCSSGAKMVGQDKFCSNHYKSIRCAKLVN